MFCANYDENTCNAMPVTDVYCLRQFDAIGRFTNICSGPRMDGHSTVNNSQMNTNLSSSDISSCEKRTTTEGMAYVAYVMNLKACIAGFDAERTILSP